MSDLPTSGPLSDLEITHITADSRAVRPGSLFVALSGSTADGRRYIDDAVVKGARAILTDLESASSLQANSPVPVLGDLNPRHRLALMSARFYGAQPETVAAVTGTNGKTSTALFTKQIWSRCGLSAAAIGTLGVDGPDGLVPGSMTTPDPVSLHAILSDLAKRKVNHAVMEASSHGLHQHRLDGVRIAAAAFTNLTQDHLDYHGTMAAYLDAKLRLFTQVLKSGGIAVLNADCPTFTTVRASAQNAGHPILDFGTKATALRLDHRVSTPGGQVLALDILGRRCLVDLPLAGEFQAMNALAALGLAIATGINPDAAINALGHLTPVRGRLEQAIILDCGAPVYVDYAHTPDGLEKLLDALRPHTKGRLVCVFGAGGDRDPTKRPLMGRVVADRADLAIVTDDNPRSEDPAAIRAAVLADCPGGRDGGDRESAIALALGSLGPEDCLVIAGKGHEQGQTIAGVTYPFDDVAMVRGLARTLGLAHEIGLAHD